MNINGIINARARIKRWISNGWSFAVTSRDGVTVYASMKPIFSSYLFENYADGVMGLPNRRIINPELGIGMMMLMLYRFDAILVLK